MLGIRGLSAEEIKGILDTAENFREINSREIKKVPTLRGKTVINLFFENSTRTRTSFELAAKRLSADAVNISVSSCERKQRRTLVDTCSNLDAMDPDVVLSVNGSAGVSHQLAKVSRAAVINAGDGSNEHPTQALLDAMTIREHKKKINGLEVAIVGDILHSRVARSNIHLLTKLGATVRVAGPGTLVPKDFAHLIGEGGNSNGSEGALEQQYAATRGTLPTGRVSALEVCPHVEEPRRSRRSNDPPQQRERQIRHTSRRSEYASITALTNDFDLAKKRCHSPSPGPMNRGRDRVEVADSSRRGSGSG